MAMLIAGLLLWSLVHFVPSLAPSLKARWIGAMGEGGYKASFAALVITGLVLIVFGWRHTLPTHVYVLPGAVRHIAMLMMVFAFVLFGAAKYPTRIKNVIRHPQLSAVLVWAVAHLLMNGDSRSIVLFGWMGCWALLEMVFINRREGAWVKQPAPAWSREFKGLAISAAIFVVVVLIHPYIAGVPIK